MRDNITGICVVTEIVRDKAAVIQQCQMRCIRQHVFPRQQTGVVFNPQQIQHSRQNVDGTAVFVYLYCFHAWHIADKAVAVTFKCRIHFRSSQFIKVFVIQTVRIMVCSQNNNGFVCLACSFQLFHQSLQCIFHFQVAGDICLNRFRVWKMGNFIFMFVTHVVCPVVLIMTAVGHIVCVERFITVDKILHGFDHHVMVGIRVGSWQI